ncbi:Eco57I restriction-modification methylase domain-containing protein [Natrarchaeobaculum sulfurireducens]|uniref:site-specific DNA-methyltransferase (adenine-specific) n=1 Tax=Natrarchaeobaculum sulfurireducens TaxID=2044521 RepID=A0A346PSI2_9EURY|nr:DNA methyltransferase [Natrarchaeobaculum sulfurireducens]AXR82477.1 Putative type IIS restriction/modification enzyme, N-terminal half [Natrarchaeobaculum sulfurireducens]
MTLQQITASDVASWDSLQDIAASFEKRGLKPRPNLGDDHELVLQLADDEFIVLVRAGLGESATDFKPEDTDRRHTNLVATNNFEEFTFITRVRTFGQQHGQIKHQKLSFSKSQFTSDSGEKNTILQKLNEIEYGSTAAIYGDLYDTQQIVKEFYEDFEKLRTELVQEVSGVPDDRGDAKQRYVQVTLDRMIFLYFIQEKRLLDRNPEYLHEHHKRVAGEDEDVYEEFYDPLFFDLLAEGKRDPEFGSLPYLNGGLFTTNPVEEEFPNAKLGGSAEETNELFGRILDFLSEWNWNVDERLDIVDPKNLSPAVLGHIFEQTVNQKEMGAYYTPEEITGFMARRSIHPYLLDQLNEAVDADYEEIDDIFALSEVEARTTGEEIVADGGTITQQGPTGAVQTEHVETLYFDILQEARVLDPAVGSGAFLLAAQDVLLDIYLQCLEYFEQIEAEGQSWELSSRTRDELEDIQERKGGKTLYAKREIILNNLYGVDIDDGAVEICKLRLWLSMVADIEDEPNEVEPLPNIDFNIRQGNSLIGFTEIVEVANDDGDATLTNYGGGAGTGVKEMYEDVIDAIERHQNATSAQEAINARRLAESRIDSHTESLDEKILNQFQEAGIDEVTIEDIREYHPFHWVLEFAPVYRDGGFDVIIGNPPWEVLSPNRDDYFVQFDETFRTKMPDEKDKTQSELLSDPEISEGWEKYKSEMDRRAKYFNEGEGYKLQTPEIDGKKVQNENELSMLFFERVFNLLGNGCYSSLILPGNIINGASAKDLRLHLLEESQLKNIIGFTNKGIFENIDDRFRFGILTFCAGNSTNVVNGIFDQTTLEPLKDIDSKSFEISRSVLKRYSPEARTFPNLTTKKEVDVLEKILSHPSISDDLDETWYASLYAEELHRAKDSDRLVENPEKGDYPVFEGKNIYQYHYNNEHLKDLDPISLWSVEEPTEKSGKHRIRMKNFRSHNSEISLKKSIYQKFDGTGSQKGFVNKLLEDHGRQPLDKEDVVMDCTEYRIAIREITNATNERTMIACVIPKGAVTVHTLHTVRPYKVDPTEDDLEKYPMHSAYERVFTDGELFTALGLLNSLPFDYLLRTKVNTHIVKYKFEESQMPRLTKGDDYFEYISQRAARLSCYGDEFEEMRERLGGISPANTEPDRRRLQAEIDAAAFHAYGLDRSDMKFVLNDFDRVEDPRLMDETYFQMVIEAYDELSEIGPCE